MKKILVILITYFGACFMLSAEQNRIEPGGFVHSVYFWLNNPANSVEREEFEKHLSTFINSSKYVKSKHIGTKVRSDRDVVDSTYDYMLVVTFNNKEEHELYQNEDVHVTFIKDAAHLWSKVVVYDSLSLV